MEGFEYPVAGTPCETASRERRLVHFPDRVLEMQAAKAENFRADGVVSYLGIPLALQSSDLTSNVPQQIAARLSKVLPLRSAPLPFQHIVASTLVWHSRNDTDRAQVWLRRLIREAAQS